MIKVNKIFSVLLTILSILSIIASLSSADETIKPYLILASLMSIILGLIWAFDSFVGISTFRTILNGAKQIGITNIKSDRLHGGTTISLHLKSASNIRIFAVSGNQIVADFLEELRTALHSKSANIKIIFTSLDDYLNESKLGLETFLNTNPYDPIITNCKSLIQCLNEASEVALEDKNIVGTIEVAFFKSHNRLPQILCDNSFGAFHISLPPKESNQSILIELKGNEDSLLSRDKKLLYDFQSHFDAHWKYLTDKGFSGKLENYTQILSRVINSKDSIRKIELQKRITDGAKYNFNNKREDRNYVLGETDKIINHHFGIGYVDNIVNLNQEEILTELKRLELNQTETLISFLGSVSKNHHILDVGCGRGGTSITMTEKFDCIVTGINISDYQIEFAKKITDERKLKNLKFHLMDFLHPKFESEHFNIIVMNEVSMYVCYLDLFFANLSQIVTKNGKIVIATWCMADDFSNEIWASKINQHYDVIMHSKKEYEEALSPYFKNIRINNYSASAIDYFIVRDKWLLKSEIEKAYIDGFNSGKLLYLFITAEK